MNLRDLGVGERAPVARGIDLAFDSDESWAHDGVIVLPRLIPDDAISAYCARFEQDAGARCFEKMVSPGRDVELALGYGIGTPYLSIPELRDVAMHRNLVPVLDALFDVPMGLHLNLTGWKSTQRAWHQDQYLNPPCVGMAYAAVWIALDDISPDAGPFEYVPGSHLWPAIDQAKMLTAMGETGSDPDWPWRSEAILGPLFDREIAERDGRVKQFIARKGDVLIWHANLCHRGSMPLNPNLERRALISHWSVVSRRCDMPRTQRWTSEHADGLMFELGPIT